MESARWKTQCSSDKWQWCVVPCTTCAKDTSAHLSQAGFLMRVPALTPPHPIHKWLQWLDQQPVCEKSLQDTFITLGQLHSNYHQPLIVLVLYYSLINRVMVIHIKYKSCGQHGYTYYPSCPFQSFLNNSAWKSWFCCIKLAWNWLLCCCRVVDSSASNFTLSCSIFCWKAIASCCILRSCCCCLICACSCSSPNATKNWVAPVCLPFFLSTLATSGVSSLDFFAGITLSSSSSLSVSPPTLLFDCLLGHLELLRVCFSFLLHDLFRSNNAGRCYCRVLH